MSLALPDVQLSDNEIKLGPQPGPQTMFLTSKAQICVYGGAASGGKSFGILLDPLPYLALKPVRGFYATIFRRETKQITQPGGLWDESMNIYSLAGGTPVKGLLEWRWPRYGTRLNFAHLYEEKDKFAYQGAQIPYIGFDELTHFSEDQFFYLFSRNRSACGVIPRMRATCNPDSESWVKKLLAPWVDDTYPVPAQSGEIRWFVRSGDGIHWLLPGERNPEATSVTFIAATIYDNKIFMAKDPGYITRLKALSFVERRRLLYGDWNIRKAGNKFKRQWFEIVDAAPAERIKTVRAWDLAATEVDEAHRDPDWTVGIKVSRGKDGVFYVENMQRDRLSPNKVERLVRNTAEQDGKKTLVRIEQEPGSSGVHLISRYKTAVLAGFNVTGVKPTGNKEVRADPVSSQAEAGNIKIVRGHWNDAFLNELEAFPTKGIHDDQVDALSLAMECLLGRTFDERIEWSKRYLEVISGRAADEQQKEQE